MVRGPRAKLNIENIKVDVVLNYNSRVKNRKVIELFTTYKFNLLDFFFGR